MYLITQGRLNEQIETNDRLKKKITEYEDLITIKDKEDNGCQTDLLNLESLAEYEKSMQLNSVTTLQDTVKKFIEGTLQSIVINEEPLNIEET